MVKQTPNNDGNYHRSLDIQTKISPNLSSHLTEQKKHNHRTVVFIIGNLNEYCIWLGLVWYILKLMKLSE